MNFLLVGGAGSVGQDLAAILVQKGHKVRVLDRNAEAFHLPRDSDIDVRPGRLEDAPLVQDALAGIDMVVHLAWSFSDDPLELVETDLKGHAILLAACAAARVSRLFYASTAVVYGKPVQVPVVEDAPCLVEDARKPFYAVAKLAAEKFALAYCKAKGLPVTVFRFWWSFGNKIGGRHLRDMIGLAQAGRPVAVPAHAGGSFLDHEDLAHALLLAVQERDSVGQLFNLATVYLEWREVARMIIEAAGSSSRLEVVPAADWRGAQFLADPWELSVAKAERMFGYRSLFSPAAGRQRLADAIARYRQELAGA